MTKGMNGYDDKEKRKMRRRNHIAKDLMSPKYRQRRIEELDDEEFDIEDELAEYYDGDESE